MNASLNTLSRLSATATLLLAAASASAGGTNHNVSVGGAAGFAFVPATLTISQGDTVTFTNAGGNHNVVSTSPAAVFRCAQGCDGAGGNGDVSGVLWSAVVTFNNPGTVDYYCELHGLPGQGMAGTIIVNIPVGLQKFEID